MKVKVFTAPTMQEVMNEIKHVLGRDAVILQTRRFKQGGLFGLWGRDMIEVMAAAADAVAISAKAAPGTQVQTVEAASLKLELTEMRTMMQTLLQQASAAADVVSPLTDLLVKNDVVPAVAHSLLQQIPNYQHIAKTDLAAAKRLLLEHISGCLRRVEGIEIPPSGTKAVAFIGPTGVGKTTTIAKLAAHFSIKEGCRVAMITADTYRISAVEQLKTYSDIMGIPLEIVYGPSDLQTALLRHQDKQLVLIDTAGRSPQNDYQLAELESFLNIQSPLEVQLVLSTTTKCKEALAIAAKFAVCSPDKFLFTKVDEASNIGTIINLMHQYPAKLSYITTGQNVPDDIELAQPEKLADLILRDA